MTRSDHLYLPEAFSTFGSIFPNMTVWCTASLHQVHTHALLQPTAPSEAQFAHLWLARAEIHPLQVCPLRGVDPLYLLVRGVFTLWSFVCASAWKSEFLSFVTGHLCPCSRKQPSSTSKLLLFSVVRSCVHYTKNPNATLRIRFCYTQVLWKFSSFKHGSDAL